MGGSKVGGDVAVGGCTRWVALVGYRVREGRWYSPWLVGQAASCAVVMWRSIRGPFASLRPCPAHGLGRWVMLVRYRVREGWWCLPWSWWGRAASGIMVTWRFGVFLEALGVL